MSTPTPAALADIARAAAEEAGTYIASVFRADMEVSWKAHAHDPVTEHDRATECLLLDRLTKATPGARVLGEEGGVQALRGTGCEAVRWIIDPIDGTANFAAGLPYLATSIAAEVDGQIVAACVHQPLTGETVWADDTSGWVSTKAAPVRPLCPAGPHREIDAVATGYFPVREPDAKARLALSDSLRELADAYRSLRSPGACALDLAYVAAGWVGVAMATFVQPWDVAAGFHLVRVAGGRVDTFARGTTRPAHLHPAFVAQGAHLDAATARAVFTRATTTWLGPLPTT